MKLKYSVFSGEFRSAKLAARVSFVMTLLIFLCSFFSKGFAQTTPADSLAIPLSDSLNVAANLADTLATDSLSGDTLTVPVKSEFETTVDYSAKDSIRFNIKTKKAYLYGQSEIDYEKINLKSENIEIDWEENTLHAIGVEKENGEIRGAPIFQEGDDIYDAEEIQYNFKTRKAIVTGFRTQEGEGFVLSERAKKAEGDNYYVQNGIYTTCNLPHPHYGIRAGKIKMVGNKQIVTGPFNLEISEVPTPIGFPFALVPLPKKRASGLIIPAYGETRERGFFLRDGGYYWAISDYMDLTVLGEIYSRGGTGLRVQNNYKKRYRYNGAFEFRFNNRPQGERGTPERSVQQDFWVNWRHQPFTRGNSSFSASVNAGTSTFNQNNAFNQRDFISPSFNSRISYRKTFQGTPFTFSAALGHNQNVQTEIVKLNPDMTLAMNRVFPFKKLIQNPKSFLNDVSISYNFKTRGEITNLVQAPNFGVKTTDEVVENDTVGFNLSNADILLSNAKFGAQHSIPLSAPLTVLRYFTLTPNANFTETWYAEQRDYEWFSGDTIDVNVTSGFSRFYNYSVGTSLTTRLYSTYFMKGKVQAIRHVMTPTVSFSYTPDFSKPQYNFYQEVQVREDGTTQLLPRYDGIFGRPSSGEVGQISLSLDNNLEMKVRSLEDPKGKKVKIFDNFGIRTAYNIAADSFNLSDISMQARTQLFGKLQISLNGGIDPYTYELQSVDTSSGRVTQRRINKFAWQTGNGIGNINSAGIALSTNFSPKGAKGGRGGRGNEQTNEQKPPPGTSQADMDFINENRNLYVDFSIPWSLNVSYNLRYSKRGFDEARITQSMNFNGDVSLTPKWKVGVRSGYDFERKEFSFTSVDITRDLHCWQMTVNWVPFGPRQSYTMEIGVKAAILQDLKLARRNNWYDRR